MDPSVAALTHTVFGPGSRVGDARSKSQAAGIIEKLTIYHWPKNKVVSSDGKLAVLAFMTAYGKSEDEATSKWGTFLFSYMCLAFDEFKDMIDRQNGREYLFRPLPETFIDAVVAIVHEAESYDYENPTAYRTALAKLPAMEKFPDTEVSETNFPPDLALTLTIPAVYGYVGLLVFLAGKRITPKNESTILEKRPNNLKNAHSINDDQAFFLDGPGQMSRMAHAQLNQAWVRHFHARVAIISEVAKFSAMDTLAQRVVHTISKMIEYAGMQQGTFIYKFLQAFPHCINYACIRPAYNAYVASVREVASAPQHLQPFYKVLYGESTRAFHRNSILTLSACATAYERYTQPTMDNFDLGDGAVSAVAMFDAEASSRGDSTLQNLTFSEQQDESAE